MWWLEWRLAAKNDQRCAEDVRHGLNPRLLLLRIVA